MKVTNIKFKEYTEIQKIVLSWYNNLSEYEQKKFKALGYSNTDGSRSDLLDDIRKVLGIKVPIIRATILPSVFVNENIFHSFSIHSIFFKEEGAKIVGAKLSLGSVIGKEYSTYRQNEFEKVVLSEAVPTLLTSKQWSGHNSLDVNLQKRLEIVNLLGHKDEMQGINFIKIGMESGFPVGRYIIKGLDVIPKDEYQKESNTIDSLTIQKIVMDIIDTYSFPIKEVYFVSNGIDPVSAMVRSKPDSTGESVLTFFN